jgi:hypothetical protein
VRVGDLVRHVMKHSNGIGLIAGVKPTRAHRLSQNITYRVYWQSLNIVGWAWDYDLKVISESR